MPISYSLLSKDEVRLFKSLNTAIKIQNFLDTLSINFRKEEFYMSPREVLKCKKAHCIEGAMLAAAILGFHGEKPLLLDLRSLAPDLDHVIALYRINGLWGAISKTNYPTMRFRDPIYRNIRELVLSYFHEYFLNSNGKKTLESYSLPFDLSKIKDNWVTSTNDLFYIAKLLDNSRHVRIYPEKQEKYLRKADTVERRIGNMLEYLP